MDRRRLLDLVDQLRVAVPVEVREARGIAEQRDEVLARAQQEAGEVLSQADAQIEERLGDNQIVKAAEERGRELVRRAEEKASAMVREAEEQVRVRLEQSEEAADNQMDEADHYALEMLQKLKAHLAGFTATVEAGIEALESKPEETREREEPPEAEEP